MSVQFGVEIEQYFVEPKDIPVIHFDDFANVSVVGSKIWWVLYELVPVPETGKMEARLVARISAPVERVFSLIERTADALGVKLHVGNGKTTIPH